MRRSARRFATLFALLGLVASFGLGCVCEREAEDVSKAATPPTAEMPTMSIGHCHGEPEGARVSSSCCCDSAGHLPSVAEAYRTSSPLERPAPAVVRPNFVAASATDGRDRFFLLDRRIDRAPPPSFQSPLRI